MITSKEARAEATGKDLILRAKCEADLDAAIRAAASLGNVEAKLYKPRRELVIMLEIAEVNGFAAIISSPLDQRDTDCLTVRW